MDEVVPEYDELIKRAKALADSTGVNVSALKCVDDGDGAHLGAAMALPDLTVEFPRLEELPAFDKSVFHQWQKFDLLVLFVAGALGAMSSKMLKEYLGSLHDQWGSRPAVDKDAGQWQWGHGKERIDRVPGSSGAGTGGHRWKFGHDIFRFEDLKTPFDTANPDATPLNQYIEMAEKLSLPKWVSPLIFWFSHLFQDMFSREGMVIPGGSYLYELVKHPKILDALATIKMRDVVGGGVTNLIMGAYLGITEKSFKRICITPNYRCFSLMLGANVLSLAIGLFPPATSLNVSLLPIIAYYSTRMFMLERKVRSELRRRDDVIEQNQRSLDECCRRLLGNQEKIEQCLAEMRKCSEEIDGMIYRADVAQRNAEMAFRSLGKEVG